MIRSVSLFSPLPFLSGFRSDFVIHLDASLIFSKTYPFILATKVLIIRIALSTYSLPRSIWSYIPSDISPTRYVPNLPSFLWTSYNISENNLVNLDFKSVLHVLALSMHTFVPAGFTLLFSPSWATCKPVLLPWITTVVSSVSCLLPVTTWPASVLSYSTVSSADISAGVVVYGRNDVNDWHSFEGSSASNSTSVEWATPPTDPIIHGCCCSLSRKNPITQTPLLSWFETVVQAPGICGVVTGNVEIAQGKSSVLTELQFFGCNPTILTLHLPDFLGSSVVGFSTCPIHHLNPSDPIWWIG